jgi:transposase-like protein
VSSLKQANLGLPVADLIRRAGISEQTFYRWKRQYTGLESDQVSEFKQLAEENGRLKKLVAELSLDKAVLQDVLAKNSPARAHETGCFLLDGVARLQPAPGLQADPQGRSTQRRISRRDPRTELRQRMHEIASTRVHYGYWRVHVMLRRAGWSVVRNVVYPLYYEEGLALRSKRPRRRKMVVHREARCRPKSSNGAWSLDFVHDQLSNGKKFRALTVIDVFSREALAIEVDHRLRGEHVVEVLNRLVSKRGAPKYLFADNGSEFSGHLVDL